MTYICFASVMQMTTSERKTHKVKTSVQRTKVTLNRKSSIPYVLYIVVMWCTFDSHLVYLCVTSVEHTSVIFIAYSFHMMVVCITHTFQIYSYLKQKKTHLQHKIKQISKFTIFATRGASPKSYTLFTKVVQLSPHTHFEVSKFSISPMAESHGTCPTFVCQNSGGGDYSERPR